MTPERIKELALANGFKLKDQGMAGWDLNPYVYDFANALLAEQATEQTSWQPLTQALLNEFELEGSGECLLMDDSGYKSVARYEWCQGRGTNHGFVDTDDRWYPADSFVSIMINP